MKFKLLIIVLVFLGSLIIYKNLFNHQRAPASGPPVVIGIFGDIHGHQDVAEEILRQMKERGVTHIIGTGDFIHLGGTRELEEVVSKITPITGVPKKNIFLCPGNWEHETGSPQEMNKVLKKYGNLVFEKYDSYGHVEIGNEKIMVSHFPQHSIPEKFLPPPRYRRRIPGQAFVMDTIKRGIYPSPDVTFEIFAHNHIAGSFVDEKTGRPVINAGVLDDVAKSPDEPRGYAIYDSHKGQVQFVDFERRTIIASTEVINKSVPKKPKSCLQLVMRLIAH